MVANLTATSAELISALRARASREPAAFTLLVPATEAGGGQRATRERLPAVIDQLRGAGLEIEGIVGDADPILAVHDAWHPSRYDEIIVCTLPIAISKWLHIGLPRRIATLTGAAVTHVVAHPAPAVPPTVTTPDPNEAHVIPLLAPLTAIGWRAESGLCHIRVSRTSTAPAPKVEQRDLTPLHGRD